MQVSIIGAEYYRKKVILVSHRHSEHETASERLHVFYIGFDIDDVGNYVQTKAEFYNELFDDIISFAFGAKNVMSRIKEPQDITKVQREALEKMYSIPEIKEARDYYLDSDIVEDKYLKRGEFGELILYHLLHEYFSADALISKIYFKDSIGLAPHGFDAVHVDVDNKLLWIGESKLYKDANKAIDALMGDLDEHFNRDFFHDEFTIITNRVHDSNVEVDEFVQTLIDPETKVLDKLVNINVALFAAFDSEAMSIMDHTQFKTKLDTEIQRLRDKANRKSGKHPWNKHLNLFLFLFPLDSKNDFVKDLHLKLKGAQRL